MFNTSVRAERAREYPTFSEAFWRSWKKSYHKTQIVGNTPLAVSESYCPVRRRLCTHASCRIVAGICCCHKNLRLRVFFLTAEVFTFQKHFQEYNTRPSIIARLIREADNRRAHVQLAKQCMDVFCVHHGRGKTMCRQAFCLCGVQRDPWPCGSSGCWAFNQLILFFVCRRHPPPQKKSPSPVSTKTQTIWRPLQLLYLQYDKLTPGMIESSGLQHALVIYTRDLCSVPVDGSSR